LGRSYVKGYPPIKKKYGGGGIMNYSWTVGMDCSELVSLCAGLRRHYFVFCENRRYASLYEFNKMGRFTTR
jgi:hypothetical protein